VDGRHRVVRVEVVSQGGADGAPLPVPEILALVLRHDGQAE
jgi:hypothetical protein